MPPNWFRGLKKIVCGQDPVQIRLVVVSNDGHAAGEGYSFGITADDIGLYARF